MDEAQAPSSRSGLRVAKLTAISCRTAKVAAAGDDASKGTTRAGLLCLHFFGGVIRRVFSASPAQRGRARAGRSQLQKTGREGTRAKFRAPPRGWVMPQGGGAELEATKGVCRVPSSQGGRGLFSIPRLTKTKLQRKEGRKTKERKGRAESHLNLPLQPTGGTAVRSPPIYGVMKKRGSARAGGTPTITGFILEERPPPQPPPGIGGSLFVVAATPSAALSPVWGPPLRWGCWPAGERAGKDLINYFFFY
jgi:hypothetical protein